MTASPATQPNRPTNARSGQTSSQLIAFMDLTNATTREDQDVLPRPPQASYDQIAKSVTNVLEDVRDHGDQAVAQYTLQFDGWNIRPTVLAEDTQHFSFEVPQTMMDAAVNAASPELQTAITRAIEQVKYFHSKAKPQDWETVHHGTKMGVRYTAIERAGIYVPGGRAAYPSTVMMTVIPAIVAGVKEIVLCTPPGEQGEPNQSILAACALAGVNKVYRIGGAQAIAAMAYGTETIPPCDVIVGPGNAYVNEAKLQAQGKGLVKIDSPAGVSEVLLVADEHADPVCVATSLIAQAEHDPMVTSILVTTSKELADKIPALIEEELQDLATEQIIRQALRDQGAIVLVRDLDQAVEVSDLFAPEHLEVQTVNAPELAAKFNHAGTIFIGVQTPTAFGDYCAGPNHTLPTSGTARFASGLSTDAFMKAVNYVEFTPESSQQLTEVVETLGEAEGLPAHVRSVHARADIFKNL